MKLSASAGVALLVCLLTAPHPLAAADSATLFRLYLKDGTSLVSYGEFARVGDRVVFSMPLSAAADNPPLHLVNIAAERVDWDRTTRAAESSRASRYVATQAEADYAAISDRVAEVLNEISQTTDASRRLTVVENARKLLADWPQTHYFYRAAEVRQMLALLDEAIANLRVAAGGERFDLSLVAYAAPPTYDPPPPALTPREAIEQSLAASRLVDSSAERVSLMNAVLVGLGRDDGSLPADWVSATRASTEAAVAEEVETDRAYQALSAKLVKDAGHLARLADVRGVQRILDEVPKRDEALGRRRPEAVNALVAEVQQSLDAAQRLRLARDRWALRAPEIRRYRAAMLRPLDLYAQLTPALEDIRSLAGSTPGSLASLQRTAGEIRRLAAALAPPDEAKSAHALLVSAVDLADNAARIRREATLTGSMPRAWDASSAAAGALMLGRKAVGDMKAALRAPQFAAAARP